jgi:hypothetical protein
MSYSDYGSYNWEKTNDEWVYKPEWEDRSLISEQVPKILEQGTGLKLDAVMQSKKNAEEHPELSAIYTDTHHSVIGSLDGFAVLSYKGSPTVLFKGEEFDSIAYHDVDSDDKPDTFIPKTINVEKDGCIAKVAIDDRYWSVAYVKNGEQECLSICGYGLGNHWWLDKKGLNTEDKTSKWPREKESLKIALKKLEL